MTYAILTLANIALAVFIAFKFHKQEQINEDTKESLDSFSDMANRNQQNWLKQDLINKNLTDNK